MLQRHLDQLLIRLEYAHRIGCAVVDRDELLAWYRQDRLSIGIRRDIFARWREVTETERDQTPPKLLVGEADNGSRFVFVYGEGLVIDPKAKSRFLGEMEEWIGDRGSE